MGTVYATVYEGRSCALKLTRAVKPEFVIRAEREARIAALMNDVAGFLNVYDHAFDKATKTYYIVMDLFESPVKFTDPSFTRTERIHLLRAGAERVATLHRRGIVHRDLKPSNFLVSPETRQVALIDFGLAKVPAGAARVPDLPPQTLRTLTQENVAMGTFGYMSPEQLNDAASVTPASDVFSLGAILFELLTGRPVVPDLGTLDVLNFYAELRRGERQLPRVKDEVPGGIQPALAKLVDDATSVDVARRPVDAEAFLLRLESCIREFEAPTFVPPTAGSRTAQPPKGPAVQRPAGAGDAGKQLETKRRQLETVREEFEAIIRDVPALESTDDHLKAVIRRVRQRIAEAGERLRTPRLTLATVGTTSSGKSTLVNGLLGRQLAPMEAQEMSAGTLTLRHAPGSNGIELTDYTDGSPRTIRLHEDQEVYDRLVTQFKGHLAARRTNLTAVPPRIQVTCSILPGNRRDLVGLPEGVGIEVIDLPGLKSVSDRSSLQIIQDQLKRSVPVVVLDYSQTDEAHRQMLIRELRPVVNELKSSVPVVFVLNRVDRRSADDQPLQDRINALQAEIEAELDLPHAEIIPSDGRLLFYAQCSWGPSDLDHCTTTADQRQRFLTCISEHCANALVACQRVVDDRQIAEFLLVRLPLAAPSDLTPDIIRSVLRMAYRHTGGAEIWSAINRRIAAGAGALIVFPALFESKLELAEFLSLAQVFADRMTVTNRERLDAALTSLRSDQKTMRSGLESAMKERVSTIQEVGTLLASNDMDHWRRGKEMLANLGERFKRLTTAADFVMDDLNRVVVVPSRQALKTGDLKPLKKSGMREVDQARLGAAIEKYREATNGLTRLRFELAPGDEDQKRAEKIAGLALKRLFLEGKRVLTHRAEFLLQQSAAEFEGAILELLKDLNETLTRAWKSCDAGLTRAIVANADAAQGAVSLRIPDGVFSPTPVLTQSHETRSEEAGTKKGKRLEQEEACCYTRTVEKEVDEPVTREVDLNVITYPDEEAIARQWSTAIGEAEPDLWRTVQAWIADALRTRVDLLQAAVTETVSTLSKLYDKRSADLETERAEVDKQWQRLKNRLGQFESLADALFDVAVPAAATTQ